VPRLCRLTGARGVDTELRLLERLSTAARSRRRCSRVRESGARELGRSGRAGFRVGASLVRDATL